jgi:aspartate carbamoyltransferase catalytic subunit
MHNLVTVNNVSDEFLSNVFSRAKEYKYRRQHSRPLWDELHGRLHNHLLLTDFFEPSTRTRFSFEAAMSYLGGMVIGTENAAEFSSFKKGESLADNFKVISAYCDIIVGRFLNEGEAQTAADSSMVPVINGGDGKGEHPTQALIDLFSIIEKFPNPEKLRISFIGDNKHSRTVQSLARLLARYTCIKEMVFMGAEEVNFSDEVFSDELFGIAKDHELDVVLVNTLDQSFIKKTDIVYITRSQIERHYFKGTLQGNFIFTNEIADMMPAHGLILHPLPRNSELPVEVDNNPRAYYFQQAHNGLFVRMAILEELCLNRT